LVLVLGLLVLIILYQSFFVILEPSSVQLILSASQ